MGNLFAGLKNATVTERGVYLTPGKYKVKVKKAILKETRSSGTAFILEFEIVDSNYAEQKALRTAGITDIKALEEIEKTLPNKPGTSASWFQSMKNKDTGFNALKGFAANVLGEDPMNPAFIDQVEEFMSDVIQGTASEQKEAAEQNRLPEGALNGELLPLETFIIQTKPKPGMPEGGPFTVYRFGQIVTA